MPRVEYTDEVFKKRNVVGKVTDKNINDEYLRKPPQNRDEFNVHKQKWEASKPHDPVDRQFKIMETDPEGRGRVKREDGLATLARESALMPEILRNSSAEKNPQ